MHGGIAGGEEGGEEGGDVRHKGVAGEGPLGWDMISMNVAFKCCLLKLPQGPRNHKMLLIAAFG